MKKEGGEAKFGEKKRIEKSRPFVVASPKYSKCRLTN
jgi:hypothetical protein